MPRRDYLFVSEEWLLIQALARAYPGVANLDVAPRLEPGEADQIGGEVHDPDRLAHVEHEILAATTQGARLQHELDGLGDGHEVPAHVRMGDRQRPTRADLREEDGHDAAPA